MAYERLKTHHFHKCPQEHSTNPKSILTAWLNFERWLRLMYELFISQKTPNFSWVKILLENIRNLTETTETFLNDIDYFWNNTSSEYTENAMASTVTVTDGIIERQCWAMPCYAFFLRCYSAHIHVTMSNVQLPIELNMHQMVAFKIISIYC